MCQRKKILKKGRFYNKFHTIFKPRTLTCQLNLKISKKNFFAVLLFERFNNLKLAGGLTYYEIYP